MNYREKDFNALNITARWLDKPHAKHAYEFACSYSASDSYGLQPKKVQHIIQHQITSTSVASHWLATHFPNSGTVQIVYGSDCVCVVNTQDFLQHWDEIFMPGRDDALVIHNLSRVVLCYCHDQILSLGERLE
ncbi:hypothetical protein [Shewanella sp.]|uniref:hypothetical protein n=1 Tax=Shewanella sp. TaxID=50422 RepID=UPI003A977E8C